MDDTRRGNRGTESSEDGEEGCSLFFCEISCLSPRDAPCFFNEATLHLDRSTLLPQFGLGSRSAPIRFPHKTNALIAKNDLVEALVCHC